MKQRTQPTRRLGAANIALALLLPAAMLAPTGCAKSAAAGDAVVARPAVPEGAPVAMAPLKAGVAAGDVVAVDLGGGTMARLVWIPAGKFRIGSPRAEEGRNIDEDVQTWVTVTKGFWLGETEITQAQWRSAMGTDPARRKGDDLPVESVSWDSAAEFCSKLAAATGIAFRLPTEAEWEYAARAGTETRYYFGEDPAPFGAHAWHSGNSAERSGAYVEGQARLVRQKEPNPWGLYDIYGNVAEWCDDWKGDDYPGKSVPDLRGPASGQERAIRGGSFADKPRLAMRSANREGLRPEARDHKVGFRVAAFPK